MSKNFDLSQFENTLNNFFNTTSDKDFYHLKLEIEKTIGEIGIPDLSGVAKFLKNKIDSFGTISVETERKVTILMRMIANRVIVVIASPQRKENSNFGEETIAKFQKIIGPHPELQILQSYKEKILALS